MTERLDQFMARANQAYYATHDPFADFTTAPEISQVFGEIIGLWCVVSWRLLGEPSPVRLVEAGPGRGTLMADALRAITQVAADFRRALSLDLIETSPRLRARQAETLPDAIWHTSLATIPAGPMILIANEFLDALPIRQFVRRGEGWTERHIGAEGFFECPSDAGLAATAWDEQTTADGRNGGPVVNEGEIVEVGEAAGSFVAALAARFASHPGAALFLDYGPAESAPGDSLQAIAGGRSADPLTAPGKADLTAHVDFAALAKIARGRGGAVFGPVPQGLFLTRLGLYQRTNRLARNLSPQRALALLEAAQRLAEPHRMGRLFKAMALCHPSCPTLPGFET